MKKCTKCGKRKELSEFYNNKSYKDGKSYMCKTCFLFLVKNKYQDKIKARQKEYWKTYREKNREKIKDYHIKYFQKNKADYYNRFNKYIKENPEARKRYLARKN